MDGSFFKSKEFAIAAVAALLILGSAAAVYTRAGGAGGTLTFHDADCPARSPGGEAVGVEPKSTTRTVGLNGVERVVTYEVPTTGSAGGRAWLCSTYGDVVVAPASDGVARVVFRIHSEGPRAREVVEGIGVEAGFARQGAQLLVAARQVTAARWNRFFSDNVGGSVNVELQVPAVGPFEIDGRTSYGDAAVGAVLAKELRLESSYGDVTADKPDLAGNVTLSTDYGDVSASFRSVATATAKVSSSYGDVKVLLPKRADAGYDVDAETDFGSVSVDVGPTESYKSDEDHTGGRVQARTQGYAEKPTRVRVDAASDYGDVRVEAA
jgi:hypothetical protein